MKKANWLGTVFATVVFVAFLVWVPIAAQKGSAPVTVENTDLNPVPVHAPNSIPVTVMNASTEITGTVNANQNGDWNVGISPSANTVKIESDAASPVMVQNVGGSTITPFLLSVGKDIDVHYDVPENKILVIKQITGRATSDYGATAPNVELGFHLNLYITPADPIQPGVSGYWFIFPSKWRGSVLIGPPGDMKAMSESICENTEIYCGPGKHLKFNASYTEVTFSAGGRVSGYLIDAPQN